MKEQKEKHKRALTLQRKELKTLILLKKLIIMEQNFFSKLQQYINAKFADAGVFS